MRLMCATIRRARARADAASRSSFAALWSDTSLASATKLATLEALDESSTFDAIVVGAGAAGGMAAMLLSEAGMSVLLLDASQSRGFLDAPVRGESADRLRLRFVIGKPRAYFFLHNRQTTLTAWER